ncbi:MAG: LptF/LptG family permease [Phycisphaerae bacterium]|nr:LptF/LptG family permease [Phycisphaerae bacterium]
MVFILHRHIFRELLRVFILAAVGLTLITSLGGILRPVQEYGLAPRQVVHLLTYLMPICLTFVLPVAALFASALTYGRFAADNEFDACRASGVSTLTLIYPGFVLAILMAIANLLLSFYVMPYFVHLAEKSLKADARQILFHNIRCRGYYTLSPYVIYADDADVQNDTLYGIVVVHFENDRVKRIITSEATKVQFGLHDKSNEVQLTVSNARQIGDLANDFWWEVGSLMLKREFGSLIEDEIKFKKIEEMKQIQADLMLFGPIAEAARLAYQQLLTELLAQEIGRAMSAPGGVYALGGESRCLRISARGCTLPRRLTIELIAPVVVEEYDPRTSQLLRRLRTDKNASLGIEENASPVQWVLDLSDARVEGTGQLMVRNYIGDLRLPASVAQRLGPDGPLPTAMPERASVLLGGAPSSILADLQRSLVREIHHAQVHILSEIHSRLIFGIGCLPMILIGIGWGILRREGHMLSAFGASCIPATILGVAIISGKQVTEGVDSLVTAGILLMWSGLGFLLVLTALTYRRLLRY